MIISTFSSISFVFTLDNIIIILIEMIIRVDKCDTFGIMKKNTTSIQTNPKLNVNNGVMPLLKDDENFKYLRRYLISIYTIKNTRNTS